MIALELTGIGDRESRDGAIEHVALAQVAADQGGFSGAGVGPRQRGPAPVGETIILAASNFSTRNLSFTSRSWRT